MGRIPAEEKKSCRKIHHESKERSRCLVIYLDFKKIILRSYQKVIEDHVLLKNCEVQFTIRCLNALNACTLHNEFCHDFLFHQYSTFYQSICKIFPTFFPGFNSCVRILDNIFNCLAKVQYKLERQFYIINETNAALPSTSRSNSDVQSCNGDFSEHTNRIRGPWEKKRPMLLHD